MLLTGSGADRIEPQEFAKMQLQNRQQEIEREARITVVLTKAQLDKFDLSQLRRFGGGGRAGPGVGGNGGRPKRPQAPEAD